MNVRGGAQVVNVVLLESDSRSSITTEMEIARAHDGTLDPGGQISLTGQKGQLNYLFHLQAQPGYENEERQEYSYSPAGMLVESRRENAVRDSTEWESSFNLGYQHTHSSLQFNGLYSLNQPPRTTTRTINDFSRGAIVSAYEMDASNADRDNWEIGTNYDYHLAGGGSYQLLAIVNDRHFTNTFERFEVQSDNREKTLYLFNFNRDRERIVRTSYRWDLSSTQGLELGLERAQTLRDNNLRQGLRMAGTTDPLYGGLVPVPVTNARSTVEELRYESFAVHNWQFSDRMSLESSLVYEASVIEQTGDVANQRDFNYVRPKLDYRFDITNGLQFRATAERIVSQLSFSDFSASVDNSDYDQNTQAGNPEIEPEQSWDYRVNLEYRLPNDFGVISSGFLYRDFDEVLDRIDVSPNDQELASARGNIGDGWRWRYNIDTSARLGFIGLPNALLTVSINIGDSEVTDPFLGIHRRIYMNYRSFNRMSFRHDMTRINLSYGFDLSLPENDGSGLTQIDIFDTETLYQDPNLNLFVEKIAFDDTTFRFAVQNARNGHNCSKRTRFDGATRKGVVEEREAFCFGTGPRYGLKVRHSF